MNYLKLGLTVGLLSFFIAPFQGCTQGSTEFERILEENVMSFSEREGVLYVTESFTEKVRTTQGKVDLVWVIDNSGSMADEAEIVRTNLRAFLTFIESKADVQFLLFSRQGDTGTLVSLPSSKDSKYSQINRNIGSYNGLTILSEYLTNGALDSFFREDALKYFVMVSDDNSSLSSDSFMSVLKAKFLDENMKFSGFVGMGEAESPCQAASGTEYQKLKDLTSGHLFNICNPDWSESFSELADHVIFSANNKLNLGFQDVIGIDQVYVNNIEISLEHVELQKDQIIIQLDMNQFAKNETLQFKVSYRAQSQFRTASN